jgi:hypothetical protein
VESLKRHQLRCRRHRGIVGRSHLIVILCVSLSLYIPGLFWYYGRLWGGRLLEQRTTLYLSISYAPVSLRLHSPDVAADTSNTGLSYYDGGAVRLDRWRGGESDCMTDCSRRENTYREASFYFGDTKIPRHSGVQLLSELGACCYPHCMQV